MALWTVLWVARWSVAETKRVFFGQVRVFWHFVRIEGVRLVLVLRAAEWAGMRRVRKVRMFRRGLRFMARARELSSSFCSI